MKIPALLAALIIITATALSLTACDNGSCSALQQSNLQLTSLTTKGGGGGGGGHGGGGGGHAGGESGGESAGHSSESDTTTNGGTSTIPHTGTGSGSDSCKKQN